MDSEISSTYDDMLKERELTPWEATEFKPNRQRALSKTGSRALASFMSCKMNVDASVAPSGSDKMPWKPVSCV